MHYMRQEHQTSVHGDIRHLEKLVYAERSSGIVHGDIRHLEKQKIRHFNMRYVHGDIRHLETLF